MVARGALTRGHSIMPKDNDRPVLKMEKLGFAAFLRDNENSCARSLLSKQSGKPALPYSTLANRFASLQADVALDEPLLVLQQRGESARDAGVWENASRGAVQHFKVELAFVKTS